MSERGALPTAVAAKDDTTGVFDVRRDRHTGRIQRRLIRHHWHGLKAMLGVAGTLATVIGMMGGGVWWLTQRVVVTRDAWEAARLHDAEFQGTVEARLDEITARLSRMERR